MVADSRLVALNHTAGLSTPQQMQMTLMAAFAYFNSHDDNSYQTTMIHTINDRLNALWSTTGFTLLVDLPRAGYYSEIDIMIWAKSSTATNLQNISMTITNLLIS